MTPPKLCPRCNGAWEPPLPGAKNNLAGEYDCTGKCGMTIRIYHDSDFQLRLSIDRYVVSWYKEWNDCEQSCVVYKAVSGGPPLIVYDSEDDMLAYTITLEQMRMLEVFS